MILNCENGFSEYKLNYEKFDFDSEEDLSNVLHGTLEGHTVFRLRIPNIKVANGKILKELKFDLSSFARIIEDPELGKLFKFNTGVNVPPMTPEIKGFSPEPWRFALISIYLKLLGNRVWLYTANDYQKFDIDIKGKEEFRTLQQKDFVRIIENPTHFIVKPKKEEYE